MRAEYELSVTGAVAGAARGEPGGGGGEEGWGDAQVPALQSWPAVARLGHLSIQEGPIGALITQAPVAPSGVRMERRGATPCAQSLPLPPGLCLSVTAPIGKTHNMNYNKHNNNPAVAGGGERRLGNDELLEPLSCHINRER